MSDEERPLAHTDEPWRVEQRMHDRERYWELYADDRPIGTIYGDNAVWLDRESSEGGNARRIVACVNSCKGWTTDTLERFAADPDPISPHYHQEVERLRRIVADQELEIDALRKRDKPDPRP